MSDAMARIFTDRYAFQRVFEGALLRWISGRYPVPGVETWEEFTGRVRAGIERVIQENGRKKRIAVFTSGGAITAVMQMALGLSDEETLKLTLPIRNASVSTFLYDDERFSLSSFNSVAHLEFCGDPELLTYR